MALNDDSPPFAVLQRSAEELKSALDVDVAKCLAALNSKISALMMDPDSLGTSSGPKSNAHVEFSMAKYTILADMKKMYEEIENEWLDHLKEMKAEFIENVQVFLANTKLEVKLPILNASPRSGIGKSPSAGKQDKSPASSIYPKLFNTAKHIPVLSSLLPQQQEEESSDEEEEPLPPVKRPSARTPKRVTINTCEIQYVPSSGQNGTSRRRVYLPIVQEVSTVSDDEDEVNVVETAIQTPVKRAGRGRKSIATPAKNETVPVIETGRRGRKSMKATPVVEASQKTPKEVQYSIGLDVAEDLEIYSPELNLTRSAPRRKTMVVHAAENFSDICLTPDVVRSKSKRKTIGGDLLDQSVAPSPKRLKRCGARSSLAVSGLETNHLESDGATELARYTPWIPLADLAGDVPAKAGVYELKVAQAKKPAYIGSCDSLRQKLTLHKLAQSSGHKHLDKFIERNTANVLVRYELMTSAAVANEEGKKRLKSFVACYKTSPAYN